MDPELQRLRSRIEMLEQRLLAVELYLGAAPAPPPPPAPNAPVMPLPAVPVAWTEPPPIPMAVPPLPVPPPLAVADAVETNAGLVWANRIGAITMILGVLFAFKYGVDNEMIGPTGRVLTGILAGIVALAGGDKLWHRRHQM